MNATTPRYAFRLALLVFGLALGASTLAAQTTRFDLGYLDDTVYYRTTIHPGRGADYWFYLRSPGMTVLATVQDFGGRGIDETTLFDGSGNVKAQSLGRIGAAIGATNLASGWHHLFVRTSKPSHEIGVTLEPRRPTEPADVGNDFGTAKDLGVVGTQGTTYANTVGSGGDGVDFYRFSLATPSNHLDVSLLQTRSQGAYVELYALTGSQARFVSRATANGTDSPLLLENLPGGTYFARVTPQLAAATGPQSTRYVLYLHSVPVGPDPAGNLDNPFIISTIPTRRPILESVTGLIDGSDAFRFTVPLVGAAVPVRVNVSGSSADFAVYLLDGAKNIFANNTAAGVRAKSITRTLAPGVYYAFVISQGSGTVNYQLTVEANLPRVPPNPPTPPGPTRVSYGGFLYDNHTTPATTMSPATVPLGGFFQVTSTTMPFAGPGTVLYVILEVQNRQPGSGGVTRLLLTNVVVSGNTLTAQAPDLAIYGHQTYNVVVATWTNNQPNDYANPGMLKVN